jgi:hypothetical protein
MQHQRLFERICDHSWSRTYSEPVQNFLLLTTLSPPRATSPPTAHLQNRIIVITDFILSSVKCSSTGALFQLPKFFYPDFSAISDSLAFSLVSAGHSGLYVCTCLISLITTEGTFTQTILIYTRVFSLTSKLEYLIVVETWQSETIQIHPFNRI